MDHEGTKVLNFTQGEIALSLFPSLVSSNCVIFGDSFELLKKFVVQNAHDDELQANLAYDIDTSSLESANNLTGHDEKYNDIDDSESAEQSERVIRKRRVSESIKYSSKV